MSAVRHGGLAIGGLAVAAGLEWVWAFVLVSAAKCTRLISRNRIATPGASPVARMLYRYFMEPGSLIMERKMLRSIAERAEGRH